MSRKASSIQLSGRPSELSGHPGGSWDNRYPSFGRTVKQLIKKQFLIKARHIASIIEFICALVVYIIIYPCWKLARISYPANVDPVIEDTDNMTTLATQMIMFLAITENPKIYFAPQTNDPVFQAVSNGFNQMVDSIIQMMAYMDPPMIRHCTYGNFDTIKAMKEDISITDDSGLGIYIRNIDDPEWFLHPQVDVFVQSLGSSPSRVVLKYLRQSIASSAASYYFQKLSTETDPNKIMELSMKGTNFLEVANANIKNQAYAIPKLTNMFPIQTAVSLFATLPIILSVMPDFQAILEEKDTHVSPFSFLMGCSETAYWLVNFLNAFVLSFIPYLLMCIMLCYLFGMIGTSFSLMLVASVLFIIGHIWFQFWLSTFMRKGSSGRTLSVVLLVFVLFFSYLHNLFTLDPSNSSDAIKHVFSIIPFSAYALFLQQLYTVYLDNQPPITWSNLNSDLLYKPWWGIMWLAIDMVIYFLLFLLFNACMPRQFGTPLIRWRELFSPAAWRRLFRKDDNEKIEALTNSQEALKVMDVHKTYRNGSKNIEALKGVDFSIKTGEVIVVMGPNGAGKSTLVNIIAGAIEPTSGEMSLYDSEPSKRFKEVQRYLGIVFQDNVLIDLLSVREHLILFGAFRGIPEDVLEESIEFFAETLQLTHMLDNRAGDLSGGQKRKLCIALSLLGNPPIIIMDEPTAGVDVQARQLIWRTIAELEDTTTIVTSHALEEAEAVSSRLFIVSNGTVPFQGTSTQLRNEFKCGYVLRVEMEDEKTIEKVLELALKYVPDSKQSEERNDTIRIPVTDEVPKFLNELDSNKAEYGVKNYAFSVEQLEDMLLKIIENDEAAHQA